MVDFTGGEAFRKLSIANWQPHLVRPDSKEVRVGSKYEEIVCSCEGLKNWALKEMTSTEVKLVCDKQKSEWEAKDSKSANLCERNKYCIGKTNLLEELEQKIHELNYLANIVDPLVLELSLALCLPEYSAERL